MRSDLGWTLDPTVTYLNHGSFGACPAEVLAVQREWQDRLEREPVAFLDGELEGHLDRARDALGAFLGADPAGLAFVSNATAASNAVLRSLRFEAGDELLTTDHEYNATLNTMRDAAGRDGARVVLAALPFPTTGADEIVDAVLATVTPRTRLAVISHVTSPTALVLPIERLVRELDARGIDTLVDGAHAPGMVPLALDALGAAYYTGNGHKWLCGPKGSGFLWVRADRRERIHPSIVSHGANATRTDRPRFRLEFDWVGTGDPTPALTLPAALDWMARLEPGGWPAVMAANRAMALEARDRLVAAFGGAIPAPDHLIGSMAAVPLPGPRGPRTDEEAARLHQSLFDEDRIEVPIVPWPVPGARPTPTGAPRTALVRVSAQRYTESGDIDRLVDALGRRLTAE
jgi:isopenicillin-N epimerase